MEWPEPKTELSKLDRKRIDGYFNAVDNLKQNGYNPKGMQTKRRCTICGGSMAGLNYNRTTCDKFACKGKSLNHHNPDDYLQISPAEIELQAKAALETMKSDNNPWLLENRKAQNWKPTL